ncbi:hypothetical protein [Actinomadura mexicana]|uniref:Uncharacterized protein n=1 Tax=Actinomadura mexicana TaxID=134959 RepID=A0A239D054_9ACTN|nr:hypothetical protein [Actinomadura mexicana]SNS25174.1 hypothetical protein SAMN06265355_113188 [Actinomadura mexicana]
MQSESIPVLTADGVRGTWTVSASEVGPPWLLTLRAEDGREWNSEADDLFSAFQEIRRHTDAEGIRLCVNGARRDAHPSGMSRDMGGGRMLYVLPPRRGLKMLLSLFKRPTRRNMIYIFDPTSCESVVPVGEQIRYFDDWVGSDD